MNFFSYLNIKPERAHFKGVPVAEHANFMAWLRATFPGDCKVRVRYRGPSTATYKRDPRHCVKSHAVTFAVYSR